MKVKILFKDGQEIEFNTKTIQNITSSTFQSALEYGEYLNRISANPVCDSSEFCSFGFANLKIKSIFILMEETEIKENENK